MVRDPLAAFDERVLETVAHEFDERVETVRDLVRRHQTMVRRLPGVDDIVYEWRATFPTNPVVERRPGVYYLSLPSSVWPEYVAALSLSASESELLRAVHRRQLDAAVGGQPTEDREAMVLTRE
jgi:hypothetical protein